MDQWELSQRFLQPLTSTRVHLLPPLSHKFLLCLGHADHLRVTGKLHFKVIHTQQLQLQLLLLPSQHTGLPVLTNKYVFLVNDLCFIFLLTSPTSFWENEKPTNEIED